MMIGETNQQPIHLSQALPKGLLQLNVILWKGSFKRGMCIMPMQMHLLDHHLHMINGIHE